MNKVLYISLTGMTEPLGRSQVLEYLIDLSKENEIYLISFERKTDLGLEDEIKQLIANHSIKWYFKIYSNKYGIATTIWQILQVVYLGFQLIKKHNIKIIHARSMIPATMGFILKKMYGIKLLFDIRGFAIDEKVDSGRLRKGSLLYKVLKKLDNFLYKTSDHIVTLTHSAKMILEEKLKISHERITVIPTCANKNLFYVVDKSTQKKNRKELGYDEKDKIIIHTGTVSGWYNFEAEVQLIKEMVKQDDNIHFLILNKKEHSFIKKITSQYRFPADKIKITSSPFDEMYKYLNIADASIFFIKPSYSKQASAPTKFAENVACHLPSITNIGVGDMEFYLKQYNVGVLVDLSKLNDNLKDVARKILEQLEHQPFKKDDYQKLFNQHFDKDRAVQKYQVIYKQLNVKK